MKFYTIKLFLILIFLSAVSAYSQVTYFSAKTDGNNVKVEWTSGDESNAAHYSIQRKTPQTSYIEITSVSAKGSNSYYSYEDQSLYKVNDVVFTYRIVTVNKDNSTVVYQHEVSVSPNISGIKRTWGSIKAMFR
jgi:hypothetical protein